MLLLCLSISECWMALDCENAAFTIVFVILAYFYVGWRPTVRLPHLLLFSLFLLIYVTRFRARFVLFKRVINDNNNNNNINNNNNNNNINNNNNNNNNNNSNSTLYAFLCISY